MSEEDDTIVDPRTKLGVGETKKPPPDLVGRTVLGRYVVEDKLGAGAMGSVFRGRDTNAGGEVAIKVLHEQHVENATMRERFRREARAASRLSHENVIAVLDVGEMGGMQLMVMELARGPTLRELMKGPLPRERVIALVGPILDGLAHAHAAGLIHRDLKPDNIIVETADDGTPRPRIVDFGIAILRDPDETVVGGKLTASGVIIGTPLYMSPEQAKGETFDHRVDLFALGVTVYEMLAGRTPFVGSAVEIAIANISKDPPPIKKRARVDVAWELEAFARKLMARKLEARFQTAREAHDMLDLIARAPDDAALALGRMDVDKATSVVALPDPPKLLDR
jgi:eukaryotic-like serine/threonine-protein kinase